MSDFTQWEFHSEWGFYFWFLVFPALWGLFYWQRNVTGTLTYGNTLCLRQLGTSFVGRLWWLPGALRIAVIVLLGAAIARPQKPDYRVVTTEGVDVVICLDVSASMNAVDVTAAAIQDAHRAGREPKNRFQVARELLIEFIRSRAESGDRVSLVIFGMGAYLKFPLTTDYRRAIRHIKEIRLDDGRRNSDDLEACMNDCTISGAQTTIGDALQRAFLRVRDSQARDRSIILITDGEDKGSKIGPKYIAEYIRDFGRQVNPETSVSNRPIPIYTFLIGGGNQTWMPEVNRMSNQVIRTLGGRKRYRHATGQFTVNGELLQEIAAITGGEAFRSYDENKFREHFQSLEKTVYKRTVSNFPEERFAGLVWLALILLLGEILLRLTVLRKFP
jgi:Ca-activated chloride channel family protein